MDFRYKFMPFEQPSKQFIKELKAATPPAVPEKEENPPRPDIVWSPEAANKGQKLAKEINRLYQQVKALEDKGELAKARGLHDQIAALVIELEEVRKEEKERLVFIETTPEGKETKLDLLEVQQKSVEFYNTHNLPEFSQALPKEIRLAPDQESRLREAMQKGFDRAILLPDAAIQQGAQDKLVDEMATKPVPGLPDAEQYIAPSTTALDAVYASGLSPQDISRRKAGKAYLLLYQSGPIPQETREKLPEQVEAELDKRFGKGKWNGLTLEEYLILQRKECEDRKDHGFDSGSDYSTKSQWTWLLDSHAQLSYRLTAEWHPQECRVIVSVRKSGVVDLPGARPTVVVELEI